MDQQISLEQYLLQLPPDLQGSEKEAIRNELAAYLNQLILHDFDRLVRVLYAVDVSEQKLKDAIQAHPDVDASIMIADLLLQRQEEKNRSRASFKADDHIPDDERW